jgi:YD repeat-containing protein
LTSNAKQDGIQYDRSGELTGALLTDTASGQSLGQWGYAFDSASSRTGAQNDLAIRQETPDNLNQLTQVTTGKGPLTVFGQTDKPSSVLVNGVTARITSNNCFLAQVPVVTGSNNISIAAADGDGNVNTKSWTDNIAPGGTTNLSYDDDGNLLSDGTPTFAYDLLDRVTQVTWADGSSLAVSYDPLGRRIEELLKATWRRT